MRITTTISAAATVAAAALLLAGCSAAAPSGGSSAAAGGEAWTIGYAAPIAAQPGQVSLAKGLADGTAELGWSTEVLDANLSADKQLSDVQTMLQKGDDVIGMWTLDSGAMQGSYAQAKQAGVPLVGVNSESPSFTSTVFWQMNLCEPGSPIEQSAATIAKAYPGGKVIVMGGPPVASITANVECFVSEAKAAGLEVVNQTDNMNDDSATASSLAADLLSVYPDVDAFWTYNDSSALGISAAILQKGGTISDGSASGIVVIGNNADADAIQAIAQGRLTGTWDPDTYATGMAVVKAAKDIQDGGSGQRYVVESTYWDKSNAADFVAPDDRSYTLDSLPLVD